MFFSTEETKDDITKNVDRYGDSYTRDVSAEELKKVRSLKIPPEFGSSLTISGE